MTKSIHIECNACHGDITHLAHFNLVESHEVKRAKSQFQEPYEAHLCSLVCLIAYANQYLSQRSIGVSASQFPYKKAK